MRGRYPVAALGLLAAVDGLHGYAIAVLGPDIARTLGVGLGTIAAVAVLTMLATAVGALPIAAVVSGGRFRAAVSAGSGAVWGALSMLTSLVTGAWALAALALADGTATASVRTVHPSLLADGYPARVRVRALAAHRALDAAGYVLGPALIAGLSAAGLTWRGVFLVIGVLTLVAALFASRLRDPGIRPDVAPAPSPASAPLPVVVEPTAAEWARALLRVPSIRRILVAQAVVGVFVAPLATYLFFLLEGVWGLDATGRGASFALMGAAAVAAVSVFGRAGDRRLQRGPEELIRILWPLLPIAGLAFAAAALVPVFEVTLAGLAIGFACLSVKATGTVALLVTLAPPRARSHVTALSGIALAGVGGVGGLLLLSGVHETLGLRWAIAALALPALVAGLVFRSAAATARHDLERMVAEEQPPPAAPEAGAPSLLQVQGITFAYDHRRVLHDVHLRVGAGELVALLGTNGAGKSTLLRVVGGFALPAAGRVRYEGRDVTFLDPERRAALGIAHLFPVAATFGSLTVREGLRVAAARSRAGNGEIARVLARFPALEARSDVRAVALSEGERRLLSLAQILLIRPRLLLADEPARGLAPAAVEVLLETLAELKRDGVAIVLVEQSLEVAAPLADRVYFLDRGRVRFEGSPADLRARRDLLRPVFMPTTLPARQNSYTDALVSGSMAESGTE